MKKTSPRIALALLLLVITLAAGCDPKTNEPTPMAKADESQITVYVSESSSTIHTRKDCNGMKYYTEMTLLEARDFTTKYCKICGKDLKDVK